MRRWIAGALVPLIGLACTSVRSRPVEPASFGIQASYRARFVPADGSRSLRFHVRLGLGPDRLLLVEVRGFTGPALLIGAAAEGRARIVIPSERRVIDGRDDEQFWSKFSTVPVSGALMRRLLEPHGSAPTPETIAGWQVRAPRTKAGGELPNRLEFRRAGARLELRLDHFGALPHAPEWPRVPTGFERVEDTSSDTAPEAAARDREPHPLA